MPVPPDTCSVSSKFIEITYKLHCTCEALCSCSSLLSGSLCMSRYDVEVWTIDTLRIAADRPSVGKVVLWAEGVVNKVTSDLFPKRLKRDYAGASWCIEGNGPGRCERGIRGHDRDRAFR